MKKVLIGFLLLIMIVTLSACGDNDGNINGDGGNHYSDNEIIDFNLDGMWRNDRNEAITFSGENFTSECHWLGIGSGIFSIRYDSGFYHIRFNFVADFDWFVELVFAYVDEDMINIASVQYIRE